MLRYYPYISLMQKAEHVQSIDRKIRNLADIMLEVMLTNNGIGLAANQIGVLQRVIVLDAKNLIGKNDCDVLINPEIIEKSGEIDSSECCLSFPGLAFVVKRPQFITVKAFSLDKKEVRIEASDLYAACLTHEIEHLDGITLIDKLNKTQKSIYISKLSKFKKRLMK